MHTTQLNSPSKQILPKGFFSRKEKGKQLKDIQDIFSS